MLLIFFPPPMGFVFRLLTFPFRWTKSVCGRRPVLDTARAVTATYLAGLSVVLNALEPVFAVADEKILCTVQLREFVHSSYVYAWCSVSAANGRRCSYFIFLNNNKKL